MTAELPMTAALARRIMLIRQPDEIIARNGSAFFERWWLARTPSASTARTGNVYLHRFLRSDSEDPHDHPWTNETHVLNGGYVEQLFCPVRIGLGKSITRELTAGMSAIREPEAIHRILSVQPGTITLFQTGRKVRDWGFWRGSEFVPWREYHGLPADWSKPAGAELLPNEEITALTGGRP